MPTYTNGSLPIFPGRSISDFIHPIKGASGEYSNYSLSSRVQALQDGPLNDHVPGEGTQPGDYQMSRWFMGVGIQNQQPLANPGLGGYDSGKSEINEWDGVPSAKALSGDYGHAPYRVTAYSWYSNYIYDGVNDDKQALSSPGHELRYLGDVGAAASFGRTDPLDHQKNAIAPTGVLENPGNDGATSYGNFQPKVWKGLPSARAL